ncbi:glycosyltransferase [Candidatus Saccharibacteria bacterium]|nr:glycosyltransferase [Candidatus Saccharibacteria bacterium]
MSEQALKKRIEILEKQNDILKRENKYLHKLTSSKRFKFAEKVATSYNGIFPKSTRRRNAMEKVGKAGRRVLDRKKIRQEKKIIKKIQLLAKDYKKIIVLNSIPWDIKLKQRPHHLASEFAKLGFFVVYLEYDNPLQNFRVIDKNLITVNSEKYVLGLPNKKRKCYFLSPNNMPTKLGVLQQAVKNGFGFIYDYLDEFHEDISGDLSIQMEVWDNLKSLKPVLCIATARRLHDELKKKLGDKQKLVIASNAVNVGHFDFEKNDTQTPPVDLKPIVKNKKPIIGFYGALAAWIDFDMLNKLAKKHQEWNFVYLGVDYNGAAIDLAKGKNVFNLGAKNYDALPKYAKYFNVATIPFKRGEIAKATSPVKLFEYMAAGLPTVCTRDLKECEGYEYVYMSKNDEEFAKNIEKAINDYNNIEARRKLRAQAEENTWTKRVEVINNTISGRAK